MAARESYGRLLSYMVARTGDVAGAEDALADAFLRALEIWPQAGIPDNPAAWLLTTARRRQIDGIRHDAATLVLMNNLLAETERKMPAGHDTDAGEAEFPDERLKLLFLCTHPAIDPAARTPLMLQTALGIDAATIANAFLVSPSAMGQRLSRAKAKIRRAAIRIDAPSESELPERVGAVLAAIYAAYGLGWDRALHGADPKWRGLSEEAVWLGRMAASLLPEEPEAKGLLALMLYCESRARARRGGSGAYIPLDEQDTALWSRPLIDEAERLLTLAAKAGRPGRYQLEAAIQSAHSRRAYGEVVDWRAIAQLYDGLAALAPTVGALVGRAAAVAEAVSPAEGLRLLDSLDADLIATYQPYWAVKAHLLRRTGNLADAASAYERAIGLSEDPAVKEFLSRYGGT
jgi:RNA polymerase sigma-70 factor (ECF subfamily)